MNRSYRWLRRGDAQPQERITERWHSPAGGTGMRGVPGTAAERRAPTRGSTKSRLLSRQQGLGIGLRRGHPASMWAKKNKEQGVHFRFRALHRCEVGCGRGDRI